MILNTVVVVEGRLQPNSEDTHLKDQKRFEKLLAVIAIAFAWVHLIGEYEKLTHTNPYFNASKKSF